MSGIFWHIDNYRLKHAILHTKEIKVEHAHIQLVEVEEVKGVNFLLFLAIVMIIVIFFNVTIVGLALPRLLKVSISLRKSCVQSKNRRLILLLSPHT